MQLFCLDFAISDAFRCILGAIFTQKKNNPLLELRPGPRLEAAPTDPCGRQKKIGNYYRLVNFKSQSDAVLETQYAPGDL